MVITLNQSANPLGQYEAVYSILKNPFSVSSLLKSKQKMEFFFTPSRGEKNDHRNPTVVLQVLAIIHVNSVRVKFGEHLNFVWTEEEINYEGKRIFRGVGGVFIN